MLFTRICPTAVKTQHQSPAADVEKEEIDVGHMQAPSWSSSSATRALQRELFCIHTAIKETTDKERGWVVDLHHMTNLYQWPARIVHLDETLPLAKDLNDKKINEGICLEVRFGPDYPQTPPYVRVVKPRLLRFMNGGGGHITAGGSVCLECLTTTGWNPKMTMESVLLSVRLALSSLEPYPARLDNGTGWKRPYSPSEAMNAYVRVARQHGWGIPKGWENLFSS